MLIFDDWNRQTFEANVSVLTDAQKMEVLAALCQRMGVDPDLSPDLVSAMLMSRAKRMTSVIGMRDPKVLESLLLSRIPFDDHSYFYEGMYSGFDGLFVGDTRRWLSHVLAWWTPSREDFVCFGGKSDLVLVVSHENDLHIGDLSDGSDTDPAMGRAIDLMIRTESVRQSIERRIVERRREGGPNDK